MFKSECNIAIGIQICLLWCRSLAFEPLCHRFSPLITQLFCHWHCPVKGSYNTLSVSPTQVPPQKKRGVLNMKLQFWSSGKCRVFDNFCSRTPQMVCKLDWLVKLFTCRRIWPLPPYLMVRLQYWGTEEYWEPLDCYYSQVYSTQSSNIYWGPYQKVK